MVLACSATSRLFPNFVDYPQQFVAQVNVTLVEPNRLADSHSGARHQPVTVRIVARCSSPRSPAVANISPLISSCV